MKASPLISIGLCLVALFFQACRKEAKLVAEVERDSKPEKKARSGGGKDPFSEFRVEEILDDALDEPDFLETSYEPLSNWLDERFEVKYRAMTPTLMFDQVPLSDIHYELTNLPENAKPFNYESVNTSRRELLRKVAKHWNLELSFVISGDGTPSAVAVVGK